MRRLLRASSSGALALILSATLAHAHHAFSPVYDAKQQVTVVGIVTEFKFVNPHALLYLNVTDSAGKVVKWTVEFAGRLNLSEVGWTEKSLTNGERVTIIGNPTHTPAAQMAFVRLTRQDGTVLLPAGPQRQDALESERRARARERSSPQK